MKLRSGFVSNSSTCSFVLIGWKIKHIPLKKLAEIYGIKYYDDDNSWGDIMETLFWKKDSIFRDYTGSCGDNERYLGVEIAQWSDDGGYIENINVSLEDLQKKLDGLKEIAVKLGLDPEKTALFAGMYGC